MEKKFNERESISIITQPTQLPKVSMPKSKRSVLSSEGLPTLNSSFSDLLKFMHNVEETQLLRLFRNRLHDDVLR